MTDLLTRIFRDFPRAPDDGEGGSNAASGEDTGGAGGGGDAPGAGSAPGASDRREGGEDRPAGEDGWNPQWPEDFPEHLRGKDVGETLEKVNKALSGYREKDAKRDIPAEPKGYLSLDGLQDFEVSDQLKPYFEQLQSDPIFEPLAAAAKEMEVERPQFLGLWKKGMELMAEAGMLEAPVDEKAERAALLPEEAKSLPPAEQDKAIDKRMQDNLDFVDLMTANRGLDKEAGEYAQLMLADTARGHKFLEWVRGQIQGGGAGPGNIGGAGQGDTRESLRAELAKPEMRPGHPQFDRKKFEALDERYRAVVAREESQRRS